MHCLIPEGNLKKLSDPDCDVRMLVLFKTSKTKANYGCENGTVYLFARDPVKLAIYFCMLWGTTQNFNNTSHDTADLFRIKAFSSMMALTKIHSFEMKYENILWIHS